MNIYFKSTDTHRCLSFYPNYPSHCKKNISFTLAYHICTIVKNTDAKIKHVKKLEMNLCKFQFSKQLIHCGIKKFLRILLQELRTFETKSNDKSLSFIHYNANNPSFYEMKEKSVGCLERN